MIRILRTLFIVLFFSMDLRWPQQAPPPHKPYLSSPRRALTAPELRDAPDEWVDRSLQWANDVLQTYPPQLPEHPVRRAALIRLDDVLHIESAPETPLVQNFTRHHRNGQESPNRRL